MNFGWWEYAYLHVVELVLSSAPNSVVEAVISVYEPQGLVCIVEIQILTLPTVPIRITGAIPEFHADMLMAGLASGLDSILRVGNWSSIEITAEWDTQHLEDRRCHICVVVGDIGRNAVWYIWSADQERDVDIFLVWAAFAWQHAVVADMEAFSKRRR